jgi:hypothetical protein
VSFVAKDGQLIPSPNAKKNTKGLPFPGPFEKGQAKKHTFTLPDDFEVAGIVLGNTKATRPDRRALGWVADRLDVDIPVIGNNLLHTVTWATHSNWITDRNVSCLLTFWL